MPDESRKLRRMFGLFGFHIRKKDWGTTVWRPCVDIDKNERHTSQQIGTHGQYRPSVDPTDAQQIPL